MELIRGFKKKGVGGRVGGLMRGEEEEKKEGKGKVIADGGGFGWSLIAEGRVGVRMRMAWVRMELGSDERGEADMRCDCGREEGISKLAR